MEFPSVAFSISEFQNACIVPYSIQRPIVIVIVLSSLIFFARYVFIININQRKQKFLNEKENMSKSKPNRFFVFLHYLGDWRLTLVYCFICFILFVIIFFIPYAALDFKCTTLNNAIDQYSYGVIITVGFIVIVSLIITYDFYLNIEKFRKCEITKFWKEDIFYMRIEIYFFGLFLTLGYFIFYSIISLTPPFSNSFLTQI